MDINMADGTSSTPSPASMAQEFLRLKNVTGQPDGPAREAALSALVDVLEPAELRKLKSLVDQRSTSLARLLQLPDELLIDVASYMTFRDIFCCIRVSKRWHNVWTRERVVSGYLRYYFPGLVESCAFTNQLPDPPWPLFRATARRYVRRQKGRFTASMSQIMNTGRLHSHYFSVDRLSHPDGLLERPHRPRAIPQGRSFVFNSRLFPIHYSHGRIATQLDGCCVVLDDLVNKERRLISSSDARLRGWELVLVAVTDQLVVHADARNSVLIVYHIHQRDFRRITIPSNLMYLYAYGSTVGFTVFQLDDESLPEPTPREFRRRPYLWRWEENLLPVDLPPSDTTASRLTEDPNCVHDVGFIFHPWDPQVFFLVSMCAGPGLKEDGRAFLQTSVSEYLDRTLVKSFHTRIFFDTTQDEPVRLKPLCRSTNSHGGFALCLAWLETSSVIMATFNVLTRRFTFIPVPAHPDSSLTRPGVARRRLDWDEATLAWNSVFYSYRETTRELSTSPRRSVVFAPIYGCGQCLSEADADNRLEMRGAEWERRVLDGGGLDGDDDVLVLGTQAGYYVWGFQDEEDGDGSGNWLEGPSP